LTSNRWQEKLLSLLADIENRLQTVSCQQNIDQLYDGLCEAIFVEIEQNINVRDCSKHLRKKFKYHKPFWNDELTRLWKVMRDAEKLYTKSLNSPHSVKQMLRKNFLESQHQFDKYLRYTERTYFKNLAENLENINTTNPKEFWDHINRLGPRKKTEIPMRVYNEQGDILSDVDQVLKKWEMDFSSLYNSNDNTTTDFDAQFYEELLREKLDLENSNQNVTGDINNSISENELRYAIRKLKNKKANGPDCIPNEVIKTGKLDVLLLKLFQICFNNGIAPSIWKKSIVVPIPKNTLLDPCTPLNYRGISLLSCIYKLYTSILNNRLAQFNDTQNLIADEQNGFRRDRSCLDHIFTLSTIIRNRKNQNLSTFCAFIDFQKAFDWINKDILLYKLLKKFNIHGKFYNTIKCLLLQSASKIRINNFYTDWFHVSSGVRQGDTLSPTLFSMYINDLVHDINRLSCGIDAGNSQIGILLYADDVVLIAPDEKNLQRQLNTVLEWCRKWRLSINETKSQVVHFRKKSMPKSFNNFTFGDKLLGTVSNYKYLGIFFNEFLDFSITAKVLADAGGRALGGIINKLKTLRNVHYSTFSKLYNTGVQPILSYAAAVWCYKNTDKCSTVQHRAIRYFLGVHRFTSNHAIEGDMGWAPSKVCLYMEMFRFWNRLVALPQNRLTKKIFNWDCDLCHQNWASNIYELFQASNYVHVFENGTLCDTSSMQSALMTMEINNWNITRHNKDKLRTYNLFKCDFECEEYVSKNFIRKNRALIAQFRSGTLPLQIEIGRFRNIPVENRTCYVCIGKIEDEFHMLCECTLYNDLRSLLFGKISAEDQGFVNMDIFQKFIQICGNHQRHLGNFLVKAMDIRKNYLFESV